MAMSSRLFVGENGTKVRVITSFSLSLSSSDSSVISRSCPSIGPSFGKDLVLYGSSDSRDYDDNYCKVVYYEEKIRDTEQKFYVEEYEVFQIINKNG